MQIEEKHSQSIALRPFEYGEEISPAHEGEGSDGVQLIQKGYGDLDDKQYHHERGVSPVDALEQVIQSQGYKDKTALDDELAGDIHHGEEARYGSEDIKQARESAWVLGETHVVLACESLR